MRLFSWRDLKRFSEATAMVHGTRGAGEFSGNLLRAMRQLLSAEICVVDWYGFRGLPVQTIYDPHDAVPRSVNEALHAFSYQNPIYEKCRGRVGSISDFLSRKQWHATALYAEGYSQAGQEDGLMVDLRMQPGCRLSLIVSRGRRGFSVEDRAKVGLLGSHVRDVFQRLQIAEGTRQELGDERSMETLSEREREVLHWLAEGKTNAEIGIVLGIRPATVKRHLENLYAKLGVENRHAAALLALRLRG